MAPNRGAWSFPSDSASTMAAMPPAQPVRVGGRVKAPFRAGNIDLHHRPVVRNANGGFSTVRSISVGTDRGTALIPTVVGHRVVSNDRAVAEYRRTGKNLGMFRDSQSADEYAMRLHRQQAREYGPKNDRNGRAFVPVGHGKRADHNTLGSLAHAVAQVARDQYRGFMASEHRSNVQMAKELRDAPHHAQDHGRPGNWLADWGSAAAHAAKAGYKAVDRPLQKAETSAAKAVWNWAPDAQGHGVVAGLVQPVVDSGKQLAKHPMSTRAGAGFGAQMAAAFPWGAKGFAPGEWDMAGGGTVRAQPRGMGQLSYEHNFVATAPNQGHVGELNVSVLPDRTQVNMLSHYGQDPRGLRDLVAPAVNRFRTQGVPIEATPINSGLANLMLMLEAKNPGMFTPDTLQMARAAVAEFPRTRRRR